MDIEQIWETPIRSVAKFSEKLISLAFLGRLPYAVRKGIEFVFWGYHFLVLALVVLEGPVGVIGSGTAAFFAQPLFVLWGLFAAIFICLYLPSNGLYSLYFYLREKNLPPSHSLLISALVFIGVVALLLLYRLSL